MVLLKEHIDAIDEDAIVEEEEQEEAGAREERCTSQAQIQNMTRDSKDNKLYTDN